MGFGKFLAGVAGGTLAIIAAPIVLPVAAAAAATAAVTAGTAAVAAGALATGTAVAAGTAIAGTAAAAGTVIAGTAAAAGTAVAGSAVGAAVTTTMGTVGAAMGTAAAAGATAAGTGAVGTALGSVATIAATSSGAAALGTIGTASVVGAVGGVTGTQKLNEAKDLIKATERRFKNKERLFKNAEAQTREEFEQLGKLKCEIWQSFGKFTAVYERIKDKVEIDGSVVNENMQLSEVELSEISGISLTIGELTKMGATSAGAGALAGLAAYGGTMTLGVASTGTAIGTLSGAAATNATLAALGGGSLATGGLGMAGGSIVLGGVVAAPLLAVGGIFLAAKGSESLQVAKDAEYEADQAIYKMDQVICHLSDIDQCTEEVRKHLSKMYTKFNAYLDTLESTVNRNASYKLFSIEEKKVLERTIITLKLLKELAATNILEKEGSDAINKTAINAVIAKVENLSKEYSMN